MRWTATEESEQAALVQWARLNRGHIPGVEMLMHVPNGGWRHPTVGARLKALGVSAGFPDLALFCRRGGYCGLAIEMKSPSGNGRVRPEQRAWLVALQQEGWATMVAITWVEAANSITLYLRGEWKQSEVA